MDKTYVNNDLKKKKKNAEKKYYQRINIINHRQITSKPSKHSLVYKGGWDTKVTQT